MYNRILHFSCVIISVMYLGTPSFPSKKEINGKGWNLIYVICMPNHVALMVTK